MDDATAVRKLYEAYQGRDWVAATALLHPAATLEMPGTGERLVGRDQIITFQVNYPEPWGVLTVERVLIDADGAAARVRVEEPTGSTHVMAAFWRTREGLLLHGEEMWVTLGEGTAPERAGAARRSVSVG